MKLAAICSALDVDYDSTRHVLAKYPANWIPKTLGRGRHRWFSWTAALKLAVLTTLQQGGAAPSVLAGLTKWFETEPVPGGVLELGDGFTVHDGAQWICMFSRRMMPEPRVRISVPVDQLRELLHPVHQKEIDALRNLSHRG